MRLIIVSFFLFAASLLVLAQGAAGLTRGDRPLSDENAKVVTGSWDYRNKEVTIARQLYDTYGFTNYYNTGSASIDVRGWDAFAGVIGVGDEFEKNTSGEFTFELDGEQVLKQRCSLWRACYPHFYPTKKCAITHHNYLLRWTYNR